MMTLECEHRVCARLQLPHCAAIEQKVDQYSNWRLREYGVMNGNQ